MFYSLSISKVFSWKIHFDGLNFYEFEIGHFVRFLSNYARSISATLD
jgi:hypothetical protein